MEWYTHVLHRFNKKENRYEIEALLVQPVTVA